MLHEYTVETFQGIWISIVHFGGVTTLIVLLKLGIRLGQESKIGFLHVKRTTRMHILVQRHSNDSLSEFFEDYEELRAFKFSVQVQFVVFLVLFCVFFILILSLFKK